MIIAEVLPRPVHRGSGTQQARGTEMSESDPVTQFTHFLTSRPAKRAPPAFLSARTAVTAMAHRTATTAPTYSDSLITRVFHCPLRTPFLDVDYKITEQHIITNLVRVPLEAARPHTERWTPNSIWRCNGRSARSIWRRPKWPKRPARRKRPARPKERLL